MNKETRLQIVDHAVRWASNILTEVLGNHHTHLKKDARNHLRSAISSLARFTDGLPADFRHTDPPKELKAWCNWYSAKVGRINEGSKEDCTGYEQDLFEMCGCRTFDMD